MALATKQKMLVIFIIIAFCYILWQMYEIFGRQKIAAIAPKSQPAMVNTTATLPAEDVVAPVQVSAPNIPVTALNTEQPARTSATVKEEDDTEARQQAQYIKLLNQYQILKMKHMLMEEQVAIATAKQKIVALNAESGAPDISTGYSVDGVDSGVVNVLDDNGYNVVYIDYQNKRWNATINNRGHFEEVTIGSQLSDGSRVVAIDRKNVVIKSSDGQILRLSFTGAEPLKNSNDKVAEPAVNATPAVLPISNVVTEPKPQVAPAPAVAKSELPVITPVPVVAPKKTAELKTPVSLKPQEVQVYEQLVEKKPVVGNTAATTVAPKIVASYSLQLLTADSLVEVTNFAKNNNLSANTFYSRIMQDGKEKYILVYGKYSTIAAAKSAQDKLPEVLKQLHPQIIPVRDDKILVTQ